MTQRELDKATEIINAGSEAMRVAKDKLGVQERIIETQEQMIEILKATIQSHDKYIAILESQLKVQDNVIDKQILRG